MIRFGPLLLFSCLAIYGSFSVAAGAGYSCEILGATSGHVTPINSPLETQGLWRILSAPDFNGPLLATYLARDPEIQKEFLEPTGVPQGYSILTHHLMVFARLTEQFALYQKRFSLTALPDVRLLPTLKMVVMLHDIGKNQAMLADDGDTSRQHEFTIPIMKRLMSEVGFNPNEILLAQALVEDTALGNYVRGNIDATTAILQLGKSARKAGMTVQQFVPLKFLYFTSDASSYPNLMSQVFTTTPEGLVEPNQGQFEKLLALTRAGF